MLSNKKPEQALEQRRTKKDGLCLYALSTSESGNEIITLSSNLEKKISAAFGPSAKVIQITVVFKASHRMGLHKYFLQPLFSLVNTFEGTVSRDFLLLVFFMGQFPPQPQSTPLGPFRIFSKIRGDIC